MYTMRKFLLLVSVLALAACGSGTGAGGAGSGASSGSGTGTGASGSDPAPTVTLRLDRSAVNSGESAMLTWASTDASACTAADGWSGALAAQGSQPSPPITATTEFSITCTGAGGTSGKSSVTVYLIPTASISAAPASVMPGASASLTWSSTDATACTASGNWSGALQPSGTQSTGALASSASNTYTYALTCTGQGGSSSVASTTVTVSAAPPPVPTVSLVAAPTSIAHGASSTLTWSSTNATACAASGGWSGALAPSGTQSTGALTASTTYGLSCTGPGGTTAPASATVTVAAATPAPVVSIAAAPANVASGGSSTLTWSSTNATACTASGAWSGAQALGGTLTTGALTANATYTLTCSGAGGSSPATSATVFIAASLAPRNVALPVTRTVTFGNTLPAGGASWSVDGIAGGNASVGTVTAAGLYTAGTQAGQHTVLAVSSTDATQSQSAMVAVTDLAGITTYHNNNARNGANTQEYALTAATVTATNFGKLAACAVDGAINAQPLWLASFTIGAARHDVVFVATQHDSVYAFDADSPSCQILWQVSLLDSAHGGASGETAVPSALVGTGAGDIQPEVGIASTPVFDASSGILYVVSKSVDAGQSNFYTRLHALDATSGAEKTGSPVTLAGSVTNASGTTVNFTTRQQLQRPGLALANSVVYVAFGSHEDSSPWYGWLFGYSYTAGAFTRTALLNTTPNTAGGGIWMSGGAPAIDSGNFLYALTGNGGFDASSSVSLNTDYGDSFLKLSPTLAVSQYWTPANEAADAAGDVDFGSGGATVLADLPAGTNYTHVVMGGGKSGVLELLNRDTLGGFTGQTVQELSLGHGLFATPALWNNRVYVAGAGGPLQSWSLASGSTVQFVAAASSSETFAWPGATPTVSSAGTQNGIVWAMETNAYCTHQSKSCGPVILHAYDATNLANELWKSSTAASDTAGYAVKFTVPTVANGHVYVGTRGNNTGATSSVAGELDIYGLKP